MNTYAYVGNNPLYWVDRYGLRYSSAEHGLPWESQFINGPVWGIPSSFARLEFSGGFGIFLGLAGFSVDVSNTFACRNNQEFAETRVDGSFEWGFGLSVKLSGASRGSVNLIKENYPYSTNNNPIILTITPGIGLTFTDFNSYRKPRWSLFGEDRVDLTFGIGASITEQLWSDGFVIQSYPSGTCGCENK